MNEIPLCILSVTITGMILNKIIQRNVLGTGTGSGMKLINSHIWRFD